MVCSILKMANCFRETINSNFEIMAFLLFITESKLSVFTFSIVMPGNGNRDTWRHCCKGAEPRDVTYARGVVYFQSAMLSALLDSFLH